MGINQTNDNPVFHSESLLQEVESYTYLVSNVDTGKTQMEIFMKNAKISSMCVYRSPTISFALWLPEKGFSVGTIQYSQCVS